MNNHYVSKCIIDQWASPTKKDVLIYDYAQNKTYNDFPINVFSKENFLSQEEDNRYSKLFETGLGRFIKTHIKTDFRNVSNSSVFRSIRLYIYFQIERYARLLNNQNFDISTFNNDELDYTLSLDIERYKLVGINLNDGFVVLPELGMFPLLCKDEISNKKVAVICVPLTPHFVLVRQSSKHSVNFDNVLKNHISVSSYGTALNYNSVVLPYEYSLAKNEEIIKMCRKVINTNRKLMSIFNLLEYLIY